MFSFWRKSAAVSPLATAPSAALVSDDSPVQPLINPAHYCRDAATWMSIAQHWHIWSTSKRDELKKLIRARGVAPCQRRKIWLLLTSGNNSSAETINESTFAEYHALSEGMDDVHCISRDIHRTFPEISHFKEAGGKGQSDLFSVLKAFVAFNEAVGYCQGINYITAMFLLQGMTNAEAFSMLAAVVERYLIGYHNPGLSRVVIDCRIFSTLLKRKLPKTAEKLQLFGIETEMFLPKHTIPLFSLTFPLPTALRLQDCFFLEGSKVMFRAILALMRLFEPELLHCQSMEETLMLLMAFPGQGAVDIIERHTKNPVALQRRRKWWKWVQKHLEPDAFIKFMLKISLSKKEVWKEHAAQLAAAAPPAPPAASSSSSEVSLRPKRRSASLIPTAFVASSSPTPSPENEEKQEKENTPVVS